MLAVTQPYVEEMECQLTAVIYAFRSPGSGATYIGKHQCSPEGWPRRGNGRLPDGYRGSGVVVGHFHRRHGAAVQWRILAVVDGDKDRVNAAERRAIRLARHLWAGRCVNVLEGGEGLTSADASARWADPALRAKMSAGQMEANARPEVKVKRSTANKAATNHPEARERLSATAKAAWSDPALRAKMSASNKAANARPEVKAKISAASKSMWSDPEHTAKMSAAAKAQWSDPEYVAKNAAAQKALAQTPERRAQLAAIQASAHSPEAKAKAAATRARNKALRAMETQQ